MQGYKNFLDLILSTQRIFRGGDATENRDFQREKQRLQGSKIFSDLPMRQKMAIFKEGNSVCRVQKIFRSHFIYTKNFQGGDATAFFLEQSRGLF